jgi:hypothetical protein
MNRATRRADNNDATEMMIFEEMRREGLTPAQRVLITMEAAELEPLGFPSWNRRQDLISAAPDNI